MSEQSGRGESADRPESGQPRGADRSGSGRSQQPGRRQPGSDVLGDLQRDLQRWLIRSSARSMRSQFEDQVRRTFSGPRPDNSDVWDVATTEIPPEVGEAPECQWCPICRAARRMRDSRPGLAGQLSGAGDTVAAAMQDAVRAFDAFLTRASGGNAAPSSPGSSSPASSSPASSSSTSRTGQAGDRADASGSEQGAQPPRLPDPGDIPGRPDSLTGEHGPVGWKPGDRLSTAGATAADPWATATTPAEPAESGTSGGGASESEASESEASESGAPEGGTNGGRSSGGPASGGPDGRGHGPSDRG